jgi:hypothetical protein
VTTRRQWVAALTVAAFSPSQRPVKATLLSLAPLMTPEGELHRWRDELLAATNLPGRTLDRHLKRAAEDGWLRHVVHGGRGRRGIFLATLPKLNSSPYVASYEVDSSPSVASCEANSSPSTRRLSTRIARHPVAKKKNYRASVSERVALDVDRDWRGEHDDEREPPADVGRETSSNYDGVPATQPPPSADGPTTQVVPKPGTSLGAGGCALCGLPLPRGLVLLRRTRHIDGCCPT